MRHVLSFTALLSACATAPSDTTDDTDDTDLAGDTDDTDLADDTADPADTDDDPDPRACTPGRLPAGTQLPGEPETDQNVTFQRVIDVCADDEGLAGTWIVTVEDDEGRRFCGFEVAFAGTVVATDCADCEHEVTGVTFTGASFSDETLCGLFGLDDDFVDGLSAYARLGVDVDAPDLLHLDDSEAWSPVDPTPETEREVDVGAAATRLTLTFTTSFAY